MDKNKKKWFDLSIKNQHKDVKTEITATLGGDAFYINGYMIHEVCEGEYAVYNDEDLKLEGEEAQNIDFPVFKYVCNAISYCLGYINANMIKEEPDFENIEYFFINELERKKKND